MKKLLIIIVALVTLVTLSACNQQDAHSHNYVSKITKEPTCTEEGLQTFTCECGDTYTKSVGVNGHSLTAAEAKAPTCEEPGYDSYEYCLECDYTSRIEIAATGHIWGEWSKTVIATYTTSGKEERVCSVCETVETNDIAKLTLEEEMNRLAGIIRDLPEFTSSDKLSANAVFNWVCNHVDYFESSWDGPIGAFYYHLDDLNAFTEQHLGKSFDYTALADGEYITYDAATKVIKKTVFPEGGWGSYLLDSFEKIDDTKYSLRYYVFDYDEEATLFCGTVKLELTDNGFVFVSHDSEEE